MIVDGERIKSLLASAQSEVLLCAPFIKARVLETVLDVVSSDVFVRVVTRWRPAEVASGVSDLEVFDVTAARPKTALRLLDELHGKLYLADNVGLVGSANLTAAALGWGKRNNVELLIPIERTDTNVAGFLRRLDGAVEATFSTKSMVEEAVAKLPKVTLDEAQDLLDETAEDWVRVWLPSCAAPHRLFTMYANADTTEVVEGTRKDGLRDLRDLQLPRGLDQQRFSRWVAETLESMPAFQRVLERIPEGIRDVDGRSLITEMRPDLEPNDAGYQWRIVREWIEAFFSDDFEVAPESFVTRLKPR